MANMKDVKTSVVKGAKTARAAAATAVKRARFLALIPYTDNHNA